MKTKKKKKKYSNSDHSNCVVWGALMPLSWVSLVGFCLLLPVPSSPRFGACQLWLLMLNPNAACCCCCCCWWRLLLLMLLLLLPNCWLVDSVGGCCCCSVASLFCLPLCLQYSSTLCFSFLFFFFCRSEKKSYV